MNKYATLLGIPAVCVVSAGLFFLLFAAARNCFHNGPGVGSGKLAPWQCVGGCGAGGSGNGSGAIQWIGEELTGGKVRAEMLPQLNFGGNFVYASAAARLSLALRAATEIGLSLPIGLKEARVQYQTNMEPQVAINGGRGDLTFDFMRGFGNATQYFWQVFLTIPTGQWDERSGTDQTQNILPQSMQMGRGIYSAKMRLAYCADVDKAMFLFDGFFDYPFMFRRDKKNQRLETEYMAYKNAAENRQRFYYHSLIKPYGESDRGDYYPPSISGDAIYAYRGVPKLLQSFQFYFTVPCGVRWIHSPVPTEYKPFADPDNRAWDVVLSYGVEFSRDAVPLFLGIGLPVHDRKDPYGRWDAPDWAAIGQEWVVALGIRAALF